MSEKSNVQISGVHYSDGYCTQFKKLCGKHNSIVLTLYNRYKSVVHRRLSALWGKKCCIVESVLEPKICQEVLEVDLPGIAGVLFDGAVGALELVT